MYVIAGSLPVGSDGRQRGRWWWVAATGIVLAIAALPRVAGATPGDPAADVAAAAGVMLPAGDPCRSAPIPVVWDPDLRDGEGRELAGGATPGVCRVVLNPGPWSRLDLCDRRRLVFHEVGHIGGRRDEPAGIMDRDPAGREVAAVPGCPGPSLTKRVTSRVLELVPAGWEVTCGRRGPIVSCLAERGRRGRRYRGRRYRGRATGAGIRVVRVREPRRPRPGGAGRGREASRRSGRERARVRGKERVRAVP